MNDTIPIDSREIKRRPSLLWKILTRFCVPVGILLMIFGVLSGGDGGGIERPYESGWTQNARSLALLLHQYSTDNDGKYPDGKNSTEVFQKLLDEQYATDPNIFYLPLPGKTPPVYGEKLKPGNVCWDVTSGVDSSAPDHLPVVFMTGYKIEYRAGGYALPLIKPFPNFGQLSFWERWRQRENWGDDDPQPGIAVAYGVGIGNANVAYQKLTPARIIPNFIPLNFDAKGKIYRQLTPDGLLPQ